MVKQYSSVETSQTTTGWTTPASVQPKKKGTRDSYFVKSLFKFYLFWMFFYFLAGMVVLYSAFPLYLFHDVTEEEDDTPLYLADYRLKYMELTMWLGVILIAGAAGIVLSAFLACAATLYESKNVFLVTMILVILSMGLVTSGSLLQDKISTKFGRDELMPRISERLLTRTFYDPKELAWADSYLSRWNTIQLKYQCCGVYNYSDWFHSMWKSRAETQDCVPESCCRNAVQGGYSNKFTFLNKIECQRLACGDEKSKSYTPWKSGEPVALNRRGCFETIFSTLMPENIIHAKFLILAKFVDFVPVLPVVSFILSLWTFILNLRMSREEQVEEQAVEAQLKKDGQRGFVLDPSANPNAKDGKDVEKSSQEQAANKEMRAKMTHKHNVRDSPLPPGTRSNPKQHQKDAKAQKR